MEQWFESIVIGGGPAGAVAALQLARMGRSVALVERRGPAETKTCGHCLNPRAQPLLEELGIAELVRQSSEGVNDRCRIHFPGRRPISVSMRGAGEEAGLVVRRDVLDHALRRAAAQARVAVLDRHAARSIAIDRAAGAARIEVQPCDGAEPRGTPTIRARLLIGADGLNSRVADAAGFDRRRMSGRSRIGFSFDLRSTEAAIVPRDSIEMFFTSAGYLGIVHEGDGTLHFGGLINPPRCGRATVHTFLDHMAGRFEIVQRLVCPQDSNPQKMNLRGCGPMPVRRRRIADRHVALVGDAAGYTEPFTGEGMTWALESARLLGRVLRQANGEWNDRTAGAYEGAWRRTIGVRQRRSAMIGAALRHPEVITPAMGAPAVISRCATWAVDRIGRPIRSERFRSETALNNREFA